MTPNMPRDVRCRNQECARLLDMAVYGNCYPQGDVATDQIHVQYDPVAPMWSVQCPSCGHYTKSLPKSPPIPPVY